MKVSKEAMVGLWVALDLFLTTDHEAEFAARKRQAERIVEGLGRRGDVRCQVEDDWEAWTAPIVRVFPRSEAWSAAKVRGALAAGEPSIQVNSEQGGLMISTHSLLPGDEEIVLSALCALLDTVEGRR
jgi:seryl-tRNA(Sec) selenium transferase